MKIEKTIADNWRSYHRRVLPPDAGPIQVRETRRAFYAGAAMMFGMVSKVGDDDRSEAESMEVMDRIWAEIQGIGQLLGEGKL